MLASDLIPPSTACCPSSRFRLRELCALGDLCLNSVSFFQRSTFDCQLSSSPSPNFFPASPLESALEKSVKKTHLSTFRMNTYKSVSKQRTLSAFRMNTYEKQGRGWPVIVNQESDKDSCPEEHRDEGPLFPRSRITDHGPGQFRVSIL